MAYSWTTPTSWTTTALVTNTALNTYARDNIGYLAQELPQRATMWHADSSAVTGSGIFTTANNSQRYNTISRQSAAASGDVFQQSCELASGTYTLSVLGYTFITGGMVDWSIDGTAVVTGQDWYSNPAAYNVTQTVTGIVIPTGKRVTIQATVNNKYVSSSGYHLLLTKFWMAPSAD